VTQDHVEEELLQRHFDGDLGPAQAGPVDRHLAHCEECRGRRQALSRLHDLIGMAVDDAACDVDFEAAFGRIERGVREQPAPALLERVSVSVQDLREQRPARLWIPAAAAVLAAAAALALVLRGPAAEQPAPGVGAEPQLASPQPKPKTEPIAYAAVSSEIEQVDFGGKAGTVFEIALADGTSTPVVWINDDEQE
jgi:anti-sigma factor RsiW